MTEEERNGSVEAAQISAEASPVETAVKKTAAKKTAAKSAVKNQSTAKTAAKPAVKAAAKKAAGKATAAKTTAAKTTAKTTAAKTTAKTTAAKTTAKKPAKKPKKINLREKAEAIRKRNSVSDGEYGLKLFYQPIYLTTEQRVCGYECLLRIVDKDLGVITPDLFLPVAKKNVSLLNGLEEWTVDELFRASRMFREKKRYLEILSLNISTEQFYRADFVKRVLGNMDKLTENICFELKEDVLFDKSEDTLQRLSTLREAGIRIAVDDFSASFLTFDWGGQLPFDIVKIDRTYIDTYLVSPKSKLIVEKIVGFARERNLDIIAVGIENDEQEKALGELGITKMQGYYYSKPLQVKKVFGTKK